MLDADLRIVVTSNRFQKDFQRDGSPMLGLRYDEALIGFPKRWPEAFRRALAGHVESGEDDTFTRPDGTIESLRWEIMPGVGTPTRAGGAFLFAELTTEKKRSERALEEVRRQLAHLTRVSTLGELSGAIAHELNQPLAAILANAQAAQTYLARGPAGASEVASILDDIVDDDLRASEVIRSLRKLLRKDGPEFRLLDFNDVIREVLELAAGDLITRHVAVVRDFAPDLPPIRGDRVQLEQVILNLIVNACEAMAASPEDDRRLRLATSLDGNAQVHAVVEDSGPGIPPKERDRIFEPFQTSKRTGLGLGLTICRSLVMAHGGRLWLTENVAGGASFHIALSRAAGPGTGDSAKPPSAVPGFENG
jgi:C4-dicarboxylate-specific signal transduction histidine kinase